MCTYSVFLNPAAAFFQQLLEGGNKEAFLCRMRIKHRTEKRFSHTQKNDACPPKATEFSYLSLSDPVQRAVFPTWSPCTQQPKQTHTAHHLHVEQQIQNKTHTEVTHWKHQSYWNLHEVAYLWWAWFFKKFAQGNVQANRETECWKVFWMCCVWMAGWLCHKASVWSKQSMCFCHQEDWMSTVLATLVILVALNMPMFRPQLSSVQVSNLVKAGLKILLEPRRCAKRTEIITTLPQVVWQWHLFKSFYQLSKGQTSHFRSCSQNEAFFLQGCVTLMQPFIQLCLDQTWCWKLLKRKSRH